MKYCNIECNSYKNWSYFLWGENVFYSLDKEIIIHDTLKCELIRLTVGKNTNTQTCLNANENMY